MSMMPPPLRNLSPLAAAATECRFKGTGAMDRKLNPNKDHKCVVRMQGDLIVRYRIRTVGGPVLPAFLHQEAAQRFDQSFDLYDPDTFFRSYTACCDAIHGMLMQTLLLREFDLAADNWDHSMPHLLATINVGFFRRDTQKLGGVALRYNIDMTLTIWADILYDEPKALLLACLHQSVASAAVVARTMPAAECCVCMEEDLAAQESRHGEAAVLSLLPPGVHRAVVLQGGDMPNVSPRCKQLPRCSHWHTKGQLSRSRTLIINVIFVAVKSAATWQEHTKVQVFRS